MVKPRTHYKHVERMIYDGNTYCGDIHLNKAITVKDNQAFKKLMDMPPCEGLECYCVYIEDNFELHSVGKCLFAATPKVKIVQDTEDSKVFYVECYCHHDDQKTSIWHRVLQLLDLSN